jgi:hypothetical protein
MQDDTLLYVRDGQLDQHRQPHFRTQQSARTMYSTLKFIKSKYRSILTVELLTEFEIDSLSRIILT